MDITVLLWMCFTLLATKATASKTVDCFTTFNGDSGTCGSYLGKVTLDDCCLNPHYSFKEDDGKCQSCRPAMWSSWSHWGACSVTCQEGVRQRKRSCYGIGSCADPGGLGKLQTKTCKDQDCCPENGGWAQWAQWQSCSVTCEKGTRRRTRTCSQPPPNCGGTCEGPEVDTDICDTHQVCPIHGGWSLWSPWAACARSCVTESLPLPIRQRNRSCTNPAPSTDPQGRLCPGPPSEQQSCTELPYCPVPGGWGVWEQLSTCSVTCGVGLMEKMRQCDSPAPKYKGKACPGEPKAYELCNTKIHCPVDGQWSEWGEWQQCKRSGKDIRCKTTSAGTQRRIRDCLFVNWGGQPCPEQLLETRVCYDINGCRLSGNWSEWSSWGLCTPSCGPGAQKTRTRECQLNLSQYNEYAGIKKEKAYFSGKPYSRCPTNVETSQNAPCRNVPPCKDP